MFKIVNKEINWYGQNISLESGFLARQADGAVVVRCGDTIVLCTAVAKKICHQSELDFLALSVTYQEKFYAAGKIPGGFVKRESKMSEHEILTSRMIDRPIRPLFPENYHNDIQVICTVLSFDPDACAPGILATIGASASLMLAGQPIQGPVAAIKVGYSDGEFIINPRSDAGLLDLVIAGTAESITMVESAAQELQKDTMVKAITFGHKAMQPVLEMVQDFVQEYGIKQNDAIEEMLQKSDEATKELFNIIESDFHYKDLVDALNLIHKQERNLAVMVAEEKIKEMIINSHQNYKPNDIKKAIANVKSDILRKQILVEQKRLDGRGLAEIRPISCLVGYLPRAHGSAIFTRGETQVLAALTIGTTQDEQMVDGLNSSRYDYFMLHYNFPPFSVGEVGALKAPGRREIGHGNLANRAIKAVMPSKEEFSYTTRIVAEVLECNGSSSMASVCAASMSLMEAGVPIKNPVAGIAMGLVKGSGDYNFAVLSDIMGDEDHLGDMDFKVAGTRNGITALQMDIKIDGISKEIIAKAIDQAVEGIRHILGKMEQTIATPNTAVKNNAPRMGVINIEKDKIREVIGSGGKVIKEICETSGAKIDIADSGRVTIMGASQSIIDKAIAMITSVTDGAEVGSVYTGPITKITQFGLFVKMGVNTEGLVHISEIVDYHIKDLNTMFNVGEEVTVKVVSLERGGKIRLSIKALKNNENQKNLDNQESEKFANNKTAANGSIDSNEDRMATQKEGERSDNDELEKHKSGSRRYKMIKNSDSNYKKGYNSEGNRERSNKFDNQSNNSTTQDGRDSYNDENETESPKKPRFF